MSSWAHWCKGSPWELKYERMSAECYNPKSTLRAILAIVRILSIFLPFFLQGRSMRRRSRIVLMPYFLMSSALHASKRGIIICIVEQATVNCHMCNVQVSKPSYQQYQGTQHHICRHALSSLQYMGWPDIMLLSP